MLANSTPDNGKPNRHFLKSCKISSQLVVKPTHWGCKILQLWSAKLTSHLKRPWVDSSRVKPTLPRSTKSPGHTPFRIRNTVPLLPDARRSRFVLLGNPIMNHSTKVTIMYPVTYKRRISHHRVASKISIIEVLYHFSLQSAMKAALTAVILYVSAESFVSLRNLPHWREHDYCENRLYIYPIKANMSLDNTYAVNSPPGSTFVSRNG